MTQGRLIFVDVDEPGISRKKKRKGWIYHDPQGALIADEAEIRRLNAIALPPAYEDAWFCIRADGHILATGRDARGRKQYRYHPDYRAERDCHKFDGLAEFGTHLSMIRRRVDADMKMRGLSRDRTVAHVVRLLDTAALRVGNEAYARTNKSFGATTLRMRHATIESGALRLRFRAKSGAMRETRLSDRNLIRFVRKMQDLRGQHLFQFLDDDGQPCPVSSSDVNAYLQEVMGQHFTAKHFRTWVATLCGFDLILSSPTTVKMGELLAHVADRLGNTPAIARKSYIHPAILALAGDEAAQAAVRSLLLPRRTQWLTREERGLIDFLRHAPSAAAFLAA